MENVRVGLVQVKVTELMESQGPQVVEEQVEQARLDLEVGAPATRITPDDLQEEDEEEEEGVGEEFQSGDWCRSEWSQDGVVYEVRFGRLLVDWLLLFVVGLLLKLCSSTSPGCGGQCEQKERLGKSEIPGLWQ